MQRIRSFFWLYRPTAPSHRAQSIQVIHAAHGTASRGHRVLLAVEPAGSVHLDTDEVLDFYGLSPIPELDLRILSKHRTIASIQFRWCFISWLYRTGPSGIVIARSKRYAKEALRWFSGRFKLILEAHEVDSLQAEEQGLESHQLAALEREVLGGADGVIANAEGTLELLFQAHPSLPPATVLHNASSVIPHGIEFSRREGIGYVGSLREVKDVGILAEVAKLLQQQITVVGVSDTDPMGIELMEAGQGWIQLEDPLPYRDVGERLSTFRLLLLPLGRGLFGDKLTSPLKLWDYLASGVPIVGADTPALSRAAPEAFFPYIQGDVESLANAIQRVLDDEGLRNTLSGHGLRRTWPQRAEELERFIQDTIS
jgi:glycosyltransferase involved in cell wall biosynthesis